MPVGPASAAELERLSRVIDSWGRRELEVNSLLAAVDRDPADYRWYVRMRGEEKVVITVWLTLRERTLHFETYFMPAPEENQEELYAFLLRLNSKLFAMRFAIGAEDAIYLVGQLPVPAIDEEELDRITGSAWAYSEQYFRAAMSIGFASKFTR
jgi:hypothetical protein